MNSQITFGDLDLLIDHWSTDLKPMQDLLFLQSAEINKTLFEIGNSTDKLISIEFKMAILKYQEQQLQMNLANASILQQDLEKLISELESVTIFEDNTIPTDKLRKHIFELTEIINWNINYCKGEAELLTRKSEIERSKRKDDLVEQLAQIMTHLLEALDSIEAKVERMKSTMVWIENQIQKYKCIH